MLRLLRHRPAGTDAFSGHPKQHIQSVAAVDASNSAVVAHCFEVIAKIAKDMGLESFRVVSNIGEQAGQSVFHLHFHVLSGRDMTWPPG